MFFSYQPDIWRFFQFGTNGRWGYINRFNSKKTPRIIYISGSRKCLHSNGERIWRSQVEQGNRSTQKINCPNNRIKQWTLLSPIHRGLLWDAKGHPSIIVLVFCMLSWCRLEAIASRLLAYRQVRPSLLTASWNQWISKVAASRFILEKIFYRETKTGRRLEIGSTLKCYKFFSGQNLVVSDQVLFGSFWYKSSWSSHEGTIMGTWCPMMPGFFSWFFWWDLSGFSFGQERLIGQERLPTKLFRLGD